MATVPQFNRFYVEHGIKSIGQLITLRKNDMAEFTLPLNSTLHYAVRDTSSLGLVEDDELFVNIGKRVLTDYVYEYANDVEVIGQPIRRQRVIIKEVRAFLNDNKKFKWVGHSQAWLAVIQVPFVINYNSLDRTYKYRPRDGVAYFKTTNFFNTVGSGVLRQLESTDRNQFIYLDVPDVLPTVTRLKQAEAEILKAKNPQLPMNLTLRNIFDTDGKMFALHLWLWAGENRHLSFLSKIPKDKLSRVNLLTSLEGRYNVLNLGTFDRWIRSDDNPRGSMSHNRAQLATLRHFIALQQLATVGDDAIIVDNESLVDKNELGRQLGITVDEGNLEDAIANNPEYVNDEPITPTLDINIDGTDYTKAGSVNVDAKSKVVEIDKIDGELSDAEDFLFNQMDLDIAQHNVTGAQLEANSLVDSEAVYKEYTPKEIDLTTNINEMADDLAGKGLLSSAEIRRIKGLATRYQKIKSPFDDTVTLEEYKEIPPETLEISPVNKIAERKLVGVVDPSMMNYTLKNFKNKYINEVMGKDIVNSLLHFQTAGIAVTDMNITDHDEYLGSYQILSVQLTPVTGKPETVKIKIPKFNEDGTFVANGVKYFCKTQRNEAPIRKIDFDNVALTSYINKIFIRRTERVRFNYGAWLVNQINRIGMETDSPFTEITYADVFDQSLKAGMSYSAISRAIRKFKYKNATLFFDHAHIADNFTPEQLARIKGIKDAVPLGSFEGGIIYITKDDRVRSISDKGNVDYGSFTTFLGIARESAPVNFAEAQILGFKVPLGLLLAYRIGLGALLKTAGCEYRREKRTNHEVGVDEFAVVFEDEVLIFNRDDEKACLIFNGFNRLKTQIRRMSVYSLDKPDAYASLVRALGIPLNHLKQYTYIFNSWVDHITKQLLIEMGEPTDFLLLTLSAVDKLCDYSYVDPNAMEGSILRGYERVAGMIYTTMSSAVRQYINTPASKQAKVSFNPNDVWYKITQDETVATTEDSNPIHSLKEQEIVVFRGQGGRGSDTMTAKHRQFTQDSIGIISEANVDNGQTGTVLYMTADPNITSLRGTTKPVKNYEDVPRAKVQSTAMMISAGSDTDDSKRVTFTSVMFTSSTFMHDAVPNRVLTGGERTIQYRVSDQWCKIAKGDGKVTALDKNLMTVEYLDGTSETFRIGRNYGVWSGTIIPHEVTTNFKVGDSFRKEDALAYNAHYFQKDTMNPGNVIFKRGIRGNMLLLEATDTLEDANTISEGFSKRLSTSMTEKRAVRISADHDVEILKDVGDHVTAEDILCTLKPPMSEFAGSYSSDAVAALESLNMLTPKADYEGVIERIEVIYTGDVENMSPSLQEIVIENDSKLYRMNKKLGVPVKTAQVPPTYAIDGTDIGKDQVVMIYYITERIGAGVGDKLVAFNQLKTIISNVIKTPYVTEDGREIDIAFSRQSISNRIVNSPDLIGTTNVVLSEIEREMIEAYTGASPIKKP